MMVIVAICAMVLAASLLYIFYLPGKLYLGPEKTRASYLRERKDAVYENLRDLNFEYKAGKVPDADYQSLKSSLQDEAATLLAEIAVPPVAAVSVTVPVADESAANHTPRPVSTAMNVPSRPTVRRPAREEPPAR